MWPNRHMLPARGLTNQQTNMDNGNKTGFVAGLALVLAVVALVFVFTVRGGGLGGSVIENVQTDFLNGLKVASTLISGTDSTDTVTVNGSLAVTGSVTQGTSGTALAGIVTGGCTIWAPANTIAASTTQAVECQSSTSGTLASGLTGVTSDSICHLQTASSTNSTSNGIVVAGVSASSTNGSIVARISNFTGTTFTWSATASSTAKWKYTCFDPS